MEKIDLTKCNNCRFKAEMSNSGPVSGRIVVDKGVYFVDEDGNYIGVANSVGEEIISINGCAVTDFEIVPRDPETYKDWQVGDLIVNRDGCTGQIIFRSGDFVAANIGGCMCYTCEEMHGSGWRLVLTDIEQQIIDEKKKAEWTPQDGDICYAKSISGYCDVFIFKAGWKRTTYYASCRYPHEEGTVMNDRDIDNLRSATDNEKLQLFVAMAKIGKRWNAEKKVVENIPKPHEFKKGEPVLVRDYENELWRIAAYDSEDKKGFLVNTGKSVVHWKQCIPYNERTMHLLGTTEDYKEGE